LPRATLSGSLLGLMTLESTPSRRARRRGLEALVGLAACALATRAAAELATQSAESAEPARAPTTQAVTEAGEGWHPAPPALIGAAFDSDAAMPAHADPIASYTLRAKLDPKLHDLTGEGTITWKNASSVPQKEIYLHLYMNAFKNERTLFNRLPVGGFRGTGVLGEFGWIRMTKLVAKEMDGADLLAHADKTSPGDPEDETDIRVALPREVQPGETLTLEVTWSEHLPRIGFRTGFSNSFHMLGQWFPKVARLEPDGHWAHFSFHHLSEFYADYGDYDVTIDVPDDLIVGATGKLASEHKDKGRLEQRYTQRDVHDFAWTAWSGFGEKSATTPDGIAIRSLFPKGYESAADVEIDTARRGLEHYGKLWGKYPYETLTLVHPPEGAGEAGGMEYPTLITTGGPWYTSLTGIRGLEIVTIHELAHQWFYGLVGSNEHEWPFLDEGFTSYSEVEGLRALFGEQNGGHLFGMDYAQESTSRAAANELAHNAAIATASYGFLEGGDYGALVYRRTETLLLTLERVYGADLVHRAIGRYARRYRFDHPAPEHLIAAFSEVMGPEVGETVRAALFDRATVDYQAEQIISERAEAPRGIFGDPDHPNEAPKAGEGYRGSVLVRRLGALRFPVDIEMRFADKTKKTVRWEAKSDVERLPFEAPSALVGVVIDPAHKVLLDQDLTNNATQRSSGGTSARILEQMMFFHEVTLGLVAP
jgi:hypothetical protein